MKDISSWDNKTVGAALELLRSRGFKADISKSSASIWGGKPQGQKVAEMDLVHHPFRIERLDNGGASVSPEMGQLILAIPFDSLEEAAGFVAGEQYYGKKLEEYIGQNPNWREAWKWKP